MIKYLLLCLCAGIFYSCSNSDFNPVWLEGDHVAVNAEGISFHESWRRINSEEFRCEGYSTSNGEKDFSENIVLMYKSGEWIYRVSGVHEEPMDFILDSLSNFRFSSYNNANDFPKRITYIRMKKGYKVILSNESDTIRMNFE